MKRLAALAVLCIGSCQEPPKHGQMDLSVRALADLHAWDPSTEAAGQASYDAVMSTGKDILPFLVAHVTDETPTMLYDKTFDITVTVGDVCFYMLLRMMGVSWKDFFEDGAFVTSLLPNPIFCVRWKEPALLSRRKVQAHLARLIPPPE